VHTVDVSFLILFSAVYRKVVTLNEKPFRIGKFVVDQRKLHEEGNLEPEKDALLQALVDQGWSHISDTFYWSNDSFLWQESSNGIVSQILLDRTSFGQTCFKLWFLIARYHQ
jgi:hypothetical protein